MRLWNWVIKGFYWALPPCELRIAMRAIESEGTAKTARSPEAIKAALSESQLEEKDETEALQMAKLVYESEAKRRETIESKAVTFVLAFGISMAFVSFVPSLFGEAWGMPVSSSTLPAVVYLLAIVHLLYAMHYALRARAVGRVHLPSAGSFLNSLRRGEVFKRSQIVTYIAIAKANEPVLQKKVNYLVVAEIMFTRGLVLVGAVAAGGVIRKILQ
ncbi:MAG: hypothetical protein O7H41_11535 [Planctomycetota bacterium]|nr:hypothetical protein [Planctomycetota bacterium]